MEITVALGQMAIATGKPEVNEKAAQTLVSQAADQGADLLLLPELWSTGYDLQRASSYATPLDQGAFASMARMAKEYGLYLAGTALEANPQGRPFNTAAMYDPNGQCVGTYQKIHLWAPLGEADHMTPGSTTPVFDLPWARVGLAICYDLRFPELWRRYALAGAEVVLIPAEWPVRRVEHWRLLLRARAVENQIFVMGCNRAGEDVDGAFGGYSAIVDPWAAVVVEGTAEAGLFCSAVDLDEVGRSRERFPFLQDRRLDI